MGIFDGILKRHGAGGSVLNRREEYNPDIRNIWVYVGAVNFQVDATNEHEQAIALRHFHEARVMLGKLAAVYPSTPFTSMTRELPDGTIITAIRNANPETGNDVCIARIKVRTGGGEKKKRAKAGGPFIWVGLRDRREKDDPLYNLFKPFMTMWEPGTPEENTDINGTATGGQVLSPSATAVFEPAPGVTLYFERGDELVKAENADAYQATCDNPGPFDEEQPSAVRFVPWHTVQPIQEYIEAHGVPDGVPHVVTESGLVGYIGGFDPTITQNSAWCDDSVNCYILDPDPGVLADVYAEPTGTDIESQARANLAWPWRYKGGDEALSQEEIDRLKGKVLDGPYIVKLGIQGVHYKPGDAYDTTLLPKGAEGDMPPYYYPTEPVCQSIPVTVKIVTGRGDYFKIQEIDIALSVPSQLPEHWRHRTMPGHFDAGRVGMPLSSGYVLGETDYEARPYDLWLYGSGPTDFGEGSCETIWLAHDTGSAPGVEDSLSQYELATFVIDPKLGARRTEDVQPWGLGNIG